MKIEKLSSYILLGLIVLSIVLFACFFLIGWNHDTLPTGDQNVPLLTDVILFYMYLLVLATAGASIWSVVRSLRCNAGNDPAASTGVPGGKIMAASLAITVISLAVGAVLGLGETDYRATSGTVTTAGWVTVVDAFMFSIAVLFVIAVIAVAVSMTGVLTKSATK